MALMPAFATVAALLALAGAVKLARPAGAEAALYAAGLPGSAFLARGVGLVEFALGLVCLLAPGRPAAGLLAAAYVAFALVVARLRAVSAGCGCFGADGPPAGLLHVALDGIAAAVAAAAALAGPQALPALLDLSVLSAAGAALALAGATYAGYLAFAVLPGLWDAWLTSEAAT